MGILALSGCNQKQIPELSVGEKKEIVRDARALLSKYTVDQVFEIEESEWPESFLKLEPVVVRRYGDGIGILRKKFVSSESGLFVPIPNYTPENTQVSGFEEIGEDLYYYWISG